MEGKYFAQHFTDACMSLLPEKRKRCISLCVSCSIN